MSLKATVVSPVRLRIMSLYIRWIHTCSANIIMKVTKNPMSYIKVVVYSPDIHDDACSTDFTFPLARWASMQPATIDPTLDQCTRYPAILGWADRDIEKYQIRFCLTLLHMTSAGNRKSNLESNALSTRSHAPNTLYYCLFGFQKSIEWLQDFNSIASID